MNTNILLIILVIIVAILYFNQNIKENLLSSKCQKNSRYIGRETRQNICNSNCDCNGIRVCYRPKRNDKYGKCV
jgi:hypothetical protein